MWNMMKSSFNNNHQLQPSRPLPSLPLPLLISHIADDPRLRQLASQCGLEIVKAGWEDPGRSYGSCWGYQISDVTLRLVKENALLPMIRYPNFRDLTCDTDPSLYSLTMGNEREGEGAGVLSRTSLEKYLTECVVDSSGHPVSLWLPRDQKGVLTSAQACILPLEEKTCEFNPHIYNYASRGDDPSLLVLIATSQGTSAQIVYGGTQQLFHNHQGQKCSFLAKRLEDDRREKGKPLEGPMDQDERERNVILIFQIPLLQKPSPPRRSYGGMYFGGGGGSDVVLESMDGALQKLGNPIDNEQVKGWESQGFCAGQFESGGYSFQSKGSSQSLGVKLKAWSEKPPVYLCASSGTPSSFSASTSIPPPPTPGTFGYSASQQGHTYGSSILSVPSSSSPDGWIDGVGVEFKLDLTNSLLSTSVKGIEDYKPQSMGPKVTQGFNGQFQSGHMAILQEKAARLKSLSIAIGADAKPQCEGASLSNEWNLELSGPSNLPDDADDMSGDALPITRCDFSIPVSVQQEANKKRGMDHAMLEIGQPSGPFPNSPSKVKLERDPNYPIRVTIQRYRCTDTGDIPQEIFIDIHNKIASTYSKGTAQGSLVLEKDSDRPTVPMVIDIPSLPPSVISNQPLMGNGLL